MEKLFSAPVVRADAMKVRLEVTPDRIRGEYRAHFTGRCALHVHLPTHPAAVQVTINGQPVDDTRDSEGGIRLALPDFTQDQVIEFEVVAG